MVSIYYLPMKTLILKLIGLYFNLLVVIAPRTAGRKAFYLFCTPQVAPLKDHQRQFLDTAEQSSFKFKNNTIRVYRWGTGPTRILFLHGWQSHTFRWKNYIDAFPKDEYTLYAFDAPAHGQSEGKYLNLPVYSQAIEKFLDSVQPFHTIVGHSLGSFAMMYTLYRLKNHLAPQQLIMTAPPGEVSEFVQYYQSVLGLSHRVVNAIRQSFINEINHFPEYFSAKKFVENITVPGLIIHDEQDAETPYHHAVGIHYSWKNSMLINTSGLGHNLRSSSVVQHVVDFVQLTNSELVEDDNLQIDELSSKTF